MIFINWKKTVLPVTLSLTLLINGVAFAATNANNDVTKNIVNKPVIKITEQTSCKQDIPEKTKVKIKELKVKLKNGEITKEQFREEMKKIIPKKEIPEELKAKFKKLREKHENDEITPEQYKAEKQKLKQEIYQYWKSQD